MDIYKLESVWFSESTYVHAVLAQSVRRQRVFTRNFGHVPKIADAK